MRKPDIWASVRATTRYKTVQRPLFALVGFSALLILLKSPIQGWVEALFLSAWASVFGIAADTSKMPLSQAAKFVFAASVIAVVILFTSEWLLLPNAGFKPIYLLSMLVATAFVFLTSLLGRLGL